MSKYSMKALRENAEAALNAGVTSREQLLTAVPALVALQVAATSLQATMKEIRDLMQKLSDKCSDYAQEHGKHVFGETWQVSPIGVESGDVTIDDRVYHFVNGFEGYQRIKPTDKLTQAFLEGLPQTWVKVTRKLDTAAINKDQPSADDLSELGLVRKPNRVWC